MSLRFESEWKSTARGSGPATGANSAPHGTFHTRFQRALDNQAMQALLRGGWIQAKLTMGDIDDPAEREAERIAAHVTTSEAANQTAVRENDLHAIQRARLSGHRSMDVPGIVERLLQSAGRPLDPELRAFFEPRFGRDFGHVRIHIGAEAAESARSIRAKAYTAGEHIVLD